MRHFCQHPLNTMGDTRVQERERNRGQRVRGERQTVHVFAVFVLVSK